MKTVSKRIGLDRKSVVILQKLAKEMKIKESEVIVRAVKVAREEGISPTKPEGKVIRISVALPIELIEGIENLSGTVRAGLAAIYEGREEHPEERTEETLGGSIEEMMEALEDLQKKIWVVKGLLNSRMGKKLERSAEERAYFIGELIQTVIRELEYFKNGTKEDRDVFREVVPPEDIGYVTTLLKALYSEDQFQRWIFISRYRSKGLGYGE